MDKVVLLATGGNVSIAKIESRKYPGILIQGDTFHSIVSAIKMAAENNRIENVLEEIGIFEEIISYYEEILILHGIKKPYK